jgi:hypothetical protein
VKMASPVDWSQFAFIYGSRKKRRRWWGRPVMTYTCVCCKDKEGAVFFQQNHKIGEMARERSPIKSFTFSLGFFCKSPIFDCLSRHLSTK